MTDHQEDRLSMYYAVIAACEKHAAAWVALPAFGAALSDFQAAIGDVASAAAAQQVGIPGATLAKSSARQAMIGSVFPIGTALQAWATVNGDPRLGARVYHCRSDYSDSRDTDAEKFARIVLAEARARVGDLADYGIDQAGLDALSAAIDAYHTVIAQPRVAITERKAATAALSAAIDAADAALKTRMDKLVPILAPAQPAFTTDYANARIIVDAPTRSSSAGGGRG